MQTRKCDVAIIGAGSAGLNACREVESAGKDWVLIDGGPLGTTCARVGCMPSKLLIAAGDKRRNMLNAGLFGVHVENINVDGAAVFERVRRFRDRFVGGVVASIDALDASRVLRGYARFIAPGQLEVDGFGLVEAKAFVIAVGTAPTVPAPLDALTHTRLTSDTVFDLESLPRRIAVVGAGVIGLELGLAFASLGVGVTVLSRGAKLGPVTDPVAAEHYRKALHSQLQLIDHAELTEASESDAGADLRWLGPDGEGQARFEKVLVATGRRPQLGALNLDKVGIELDKRGRPKGWRPDTAQVGEKGVFVAGDAAGHRPVLHEAADEGSIAGGNAASFPAVESCKRRTPLTVVFTHPQAALFGIDFEQAHERDAALGELCFEDQGRAKVLGENVGVIRLYGCRKSGQLLGGTIVGPGAEHLGHLMAWSVQAGLYVHEVLDMPFYHPVLEEGLRTALRGLAKQVPPAPDDRLPRRSDCVGD